MAGHLPPEPPVLAPPGAGIPWPTRLLAKYAGLPLFRRRHSPRACRLIFQRVGEKILDKAAPLPEAALDTRVLVPPQRGLEDSSRWWSAAMTLEHLIITGTLFADAVTMLSHGEVPQAQLGTADVKPPRAIPAAETPARFRAFLAGFESRMETAHFPLRDDVKYPHPWFGPLGAHDWLCVAVLHQGIHQRQIAAILSGLQAAGRL